MLEQILSKIFCFMKPRREPHFSKKSDWMLPVHAVAEDGTVIGCHNSSSVNFAINDIGIHSSWHHDEYIAKYPQGYELIWLHNPEEDIRFATIWPLYVEKNLKPEDIPLTAERDYEKAYPQYVHTNRPLTSNGWRRIAINKWERTVLTSKATITRTKTGLSGSGDLAILAEGYLLLADR